MNQTFPDGFPKDPYQAVDFSYFLTDQEKQEWYDWIPNATPEQQQELVDTLHEIWQENQKEAIPQGFASNQPGAAFPSGNPAFNASNGTTNNQTFNAGPASTPQPNRAVSTPVPPTGPLPIPPNDPFGQPLNQPQFPVNNQPTKATAPIPPTPSPQPPVSQPQPLSNTNPTQTKPNLSDDPINPLNQPPFNNNFAATQPQTTSQTQIPFDQINVTNDYDSSLKPTPSTNQATNTTTTNNTQPYSQNFQKPEDSDKKSKSSEEATKIPVNVNATSGDSVGIINRTSKTNDNVTLGNKNQNDQQILRNQTTLIEKVIRILNRLERTVEELRVSQKQDAGEAIINGLSQTTQKIHQDTAVLSEMVNRLYDETSILRTMVQNQQDEIRTLKIHIEKLYTQNLKSRNSDTQSNSEIEIKPNQNPTNNPFGNPFR